MTARTCLAKNCWKMHGATNFPKKQWITGRSCSRPRTLRNEETGRLNVILYCHALVYARSESLSCSQTSLTLSEQQDVGMSFGASADMPFVRGSEPHSSNAAMSGAPGKRYHMSGRRLN